MNSWPSFSSTDQVALTRNCPALTRRLQCPTARETFEAFSINPMHSAYSAEYLDIFVSANFIIGYSIGRQFRGLGLGKKLLSDAIDIFRKSSGFYLSGDVKENNLVLKSLRDHYFYQP